MQPNTTFPESTGSSRSWWCRLAASIVNGGLIVVAVALLVLPRRPWSEPALAMIVALAPFGMIAALAATGLSAVRRRWVSLTIAVLLSVGHLSTQGLLTMPVGRAAEADGATGIRIASANLLSGNDRLDEALDRVRSTNSDIVLLEEVDREAAISLERSGLLAAYPHNLVDARPGYFGSAILSRLPLVDPAVIEVAGWPMTAARVRVGGKEVQVVNVHVPPPLDDDHLAVWSAQLEELSGFVDGSATVLMGDFNATRDHAQFRRLLDHGLTDGLDQAGWAPTWPTDRLFPAMLRLDHALTGGDLTTVSAGTFSVPGSDHRGVIVSLAPASAG